MDSIYIKDGKEEMMSRALIAAMIGLAVAYIINRFLEKK